LYQIISATFVSGKPDITGITAGLAAVNGSYYTGQPNAVCALSPAATVWSSAIRG